MVDQPFPTNQTATVVNSVVDGVFGIAVKTVEASLVAANPALFGNPILEKIDNEVIELVANALYQQFAEWVTFEVIDFQVSGEVSDEKKALIALKAAQKSGDPNAIAQALAAFQKAVVGLTVFDGAAQPGSL